MKRGNDEQRIKSWLTGRPWRSPQVSLSQRRGLPWLIGLVSSLGTLVLWYQLSRQDQLHSQQLALSELSSLQGTIASEFSEREQGLKRMGQRWSVASNAQETQRRIDAAAYIEDYPSVSHIGWVTPRQQVRWLAHSQARTAFDGSALPPSTLVPADCQRASPQVTAELAVAPPGNQILVSLPICVGDRRDGWLVAVVDAPMFFEKAVQKHLNLHSNFERDGYAIYDGDTLIHHQQPALSSQQTSPLFAKNLQVPLRILGKTWRLQLLPAADSPRYHSSSLSRIVLGSGIIFSWLLALVVHLTQAQQRKIKQVEALLQNLRQEMADRTQAQQELQASYRLLESMIEGICTPIFVKNRQGCYVFLNESMAQLLAKPKPLILGRSDRELLASSQELLAVLSESDHRILQSGQPETLEADWPQAQQLRHFLMAKSAWRNGSGEIIGLLGVANDITERTQTEIQLRYSEERYRSLVIATSQIVWTTNAQGEMITSQPSWSTYTGQTFEDCWQRGWTNALHPLCRQNLLERWHQAIQTSSPLETECRIANRHGDYGFFAIKAVPVLADSGQIREWVAIGSDISDRKQAEQKVQELNQILEQRVIERTAQLAAANEALQGAKTAAEAASRAKSQFLANMSHELRTPLNGILGYTQLLLKDYNSQIQRERLAIVQQCGEHLLDLVNDLLSLAKIEAQKLELYPQPLHLPTFLQSVADMCCLSATSKQLQWCYDATEIDSLDAWVLADEKRLRQVLLNLLSNAIKYTESGRITLQVKLLSQTQEHLFLKFRVTDTGIGIASDEIERIFQPFEQGNVCWQRHIEGTGLGLAISQRLVQLMGSKLQVTSQLGRGSTFWFDLELPLSIECYLHQENSEEIQFIVGVAEPVPRILVAEPLARDRLILVNFLDSLGFIMAAASNGATLQEKVTAFEPQLLIVSAELLSLEPAVQAQLQQQLCAQDIKMITLAPKELAEPSQPLVAASDAFLSKPVRFLRLLETMGELLPIEWIYASPTTKIYPKFVALSASASYARDKNSLIPPPPAELEQFYQLAYKGDIKGLREQAAQLEQKPSYGEFARTILTLARNFQEKEIRQLIDRFRQ